MKRKFFSLAFCGALALATAVQADVISVNFVSSPTNSPGQVMLPATTAGLYSRNNWNNAYDNLTNSTAGTVGSLTNDAGAATTASIDWISSNTWSDSQAADDADSGVGDAQMALGYLDDGDTGSGNGVTITVSGVPYANYTAVVLLSTDTPGGLYQPAQINGASFATTGEKYRYFPNNWQPYNTIIASNLTDGTLSIILPVKPEGNERASVAGIQIVESTEGAPPPFLPLAPDWVESPINGGSVIVGNTYTGTLVGKAVDRDGDDTLITFSKISGDAWLTVSSDGTMEGPAPGTAGTNTFIVAASDGTGSTEETLQIIVNDPPVTGEGTAISVNFTEGNANQLMATGTTAGRTGYVYANWNNTTGPADTAGSLNDSDGNSTAASVTWTSGGVWGDGSANDDANDAVGNAQVARGYLDDGAPGADWTVTGIPYGTYNVILYFATDTDGDFYLPITVNGDAYSTTVSKLQYGGNPNWDDSNSIVITDLSGDLIVDSLPRDGNARASVAGFQIIDVAYVPGGPVTDLTIDGPVSSGTEMVLMWTGEDAKLYSVETNSNLIVADWQLFETNIVGNGGTINVTNTIGPNQTFYRVISE